MKNATTSRRTVVAGLGAAASLLACKPPGFPADGSSLGMAVVGLGSLSEGQILPALRETQRWHVAGLVSDNPAIDAVYIALPTALHAEFAVRAARAGKHVFVEKPMAVSVAECETMIEASRSAGKYLGVAYRCQYEPHHRELMRLAREEEFGKLKLINVKIGFPPSGPDDWRLKRALAGGGALMELGVYGVQAARYITGEEPIDVSGFEGGVRQDAFSEVEETAMWSMRFPSGVLATCFACYTTRMDHVWAGAEGGDMTLSPAFVYDGLEGKTSGGIIRFSHGNQFAVQLDEFGRSIQDGTLHPTAGEEGLRDLRIFDSIYESMATERRVAVSAGVPQLASRARARSTV
jgi:predicted dehydrogenase